MRRETSLDLVERDLVAVLLRPGPRWLDVIREAWNRKAAVLPIDARLPGTAGERLVRRARATAILTEDGAIRRLVDGEPVDGGVALVVATSGTSGEPNLVELERGAIEAAVRSSAEALEASADDGWLMCLPTSHIGGMLVLFRGLLLDARVDVHPSFDPERIRSATAAFASIVPTMLVRLLDAGVDLGAFKSILVGGGGVTPDLRDRAERTGARVVETYGLTESCGGVVYDGVPLRGVRVRTDPNDVIELAGPTLMRGYRLDPRATAEAFTGDGWLRTRDVAMFDADRRLHVAGRADDAITTGGEMVWPREVESVIASHPKVAEVSVVGRRDPEWGERVVALVVPRHHADPPTLDELRALATERLARYKAPRELEIVTRLPRTAIGKVRRPARTQG